MCHGLVLILFCTCFETAVRVPLLGIVRQDDRTCTSCDSFVRDSSMKKKEALRGDACISHSMEILCVIGLDFPL